MTPARMIVVAIPLLLATPSVAAPFRVVKPTMLEGVCAITSTGTIVCEKQHILPDVDVVARDLVPAYEPIVVRDDGTLVRVPRKAFSDDKVKLESIAVPFKVRRAGIVGSPKSDRLCVLGDKGELACAPFDHTKSALTFTRVAGTFKEVTFADDVLWALDDRGALWCGGARDCARVHAAAKKAPKKSLLELGTTWPGPTERPPDAPFVRVADGVKRVYGSGSPCIERTSDPDKLVCWSSTKAPAAYPRPKGDELASVGSMMCARTADSITCTMFGSKFHEPSTVTAKGAVKMHFGARAFCVETKDAELRCAQISNPLPPFETVTWATRRKD